MWERPPDSKWETNALKPRTSRFCPMHRKWISPYISDMTSDTSEVHKTRFHQGDSSFYFRIRVFGIGLIGSDKLSVLRELPILVHPNEQAQLFRLSN